MLSSFTRKVFFRKQVQRCLDFSTTACVGKVYNEPLSGHEMPRAGGIASMMRLPVQTDTEGLDACFVGVPLDIGTSNRSGTRYGPRQIRCESSLIRKVNIATGACPFDSMQVADVGDVNLNLYNLPKACEDIRKHFCNLIRNGCITLAMGGDHTLTYPILQAIKEKYGPVGLVHVDAHSDTNDEMLGEKIAHGTPFRRAFEEGCLVGNKVIQIGLRGSNYHLTDYDWGKQQGFKIVQSHECWHKSLTGLMEEVRDMMGNHPVYISFDIDALDPSFAPGTGTPEIGGLTSIQGLEIIRGCKGLNIIGGDLVEVSPPYDFQGTTALTGANLLFEMLCILPKVKYDLK
ncbi:guanidinobutyrase-like [Ruditapes philippinarum]|uniref:guanidinobutyrase-like n=1 Tax=Ruditapes philippinarum TaxID=129788 RepID=UPI00295A955D|nr:guanidinobutyrase-like [Ruditapes philippinarum]